MNLFLCTSTHSSSCSSWWSTSAMAIRCASGDPRLDSDFDEWSVKMLSLSVSSSRFPRGRDSLRARLGHTCRVQGAITARVLVGVGAGSRVNAPLNVWWFGDAQTLHKSLAGGQAAIETAKNTRGLNTFTPTVLMGKSMIFPFLHFSC